ncbi:MAG: DUF2452 domain-containing protein [Gammaproteobacteria bacterium]|nr:DUF2452 domain-containing protein [Gammaproteobacteria bacterium]MDH5736281.1 DUF2452 domain-containing protein [Gammaproteobacteria bacterium]
MTKPPSKHTGANHQGEASTSPYPVSRLAPQVELVDLARQISEADAMVNTRVSAKLKVIADQIKSLQREAQAVLEEARLDQDLHRAECNFKRIPGKIYHLYQKSNGHTYFSMLSPADWQGSAPHEYVNSYRLENDMSWLPVDRLDDKDDSRELINRLLLEKGF